jgi:hypothetical protein
MGGGAMKVEGFLYGGKRIYFMDFKGAYKSKYFERKRWGIELYYKPNFSKYFSTGWEKKYLDFKKKYSIFSYGNFSDFEKDWNSEHIDGRDNTKDQ